MQYSSPGYCVSRPHSSIASVPGTGGMVLPPTGGVAGAAEPALPMFAGGCVGRPAPGLGGIGSMLAPEPAITVGAGAPATGTADGITAPFVAGTSLPCDRPVPASLALPQAARQKVTAAHVARRRLMKC